MKNKNIELYLLDPAHAQAAGDPMLFDSSTNTTHRQIGMISLMGTIHHRAGYFSTSLIDLKEAISQFINDPSISGIILDIDSPGGEAAGIAEFASWLCQQRQIKPIVSYVDELCASAAYWIAAATSHIVAPPSARIGSIGVIALHANMSKMLESIGISLSVFRKKSRKAEGSPFEPLSDAAKAGIQSEIDQMYDFFISGVANLRDMSVPDVQVMAGESEVFYAQDALNRKMIDRIGNMDTAVSVLMEMIGEPMNDQEITAAASVPEDYSRLQAELKSALEEKAKFESELARMKITDRMNLIIADGKLPKSFLSDQFVSWCSRLAEDDRDFLLNALDSLPMVWEIGNSLDADDAPTAPEPIDLEELGAQIANVDTE